jgi:hypothetical protein
MYKNLVENGCGNDDHSSLYKEIERMNEKWVEDWQIKILL